MVLRRAREIVLTVDGERRTVWSTALTVDDAMRQLNFAGDAYASASRGQRIPLDGIEFDVVNAKAVRISDNGAPHADVRVAAPTVGALLDVTNVPLEQADTVVPAPETPLTDGLEIVVTRNRTETRTENQPIQAPEKPRRRSGTRAGEDHRREPRHTGGADGDGDRHDRERCRDGPPGTVVRGGP